MTEADVYQLIADTWRRRERLAVCDWVREYIHSVPYSPRAFELTPMMAEVLDAIADPLNRRVHIVAAVQSGKTLAPEIALAYLIANSPAPALWLNQTDAEAKDQSEGRLRQLFDGIEPVARLYNADRNKMRKDTMVFNNAMTLWILGQNNLRNLQRRSICYVFGDETWQWERGRMEEVAARTTAFTRGKCVFMSQAGVAGDDTETGWLSTDQREWTWECPDCGADWAPSLEHLDTETGAMRCPSCGALLEPGDYNLRRLNDGGRFVRHNPDAQPGRVGFHWSALATMDWREVAALYNDAMDASDRGDDERLKQFVQKRLALPWSAEALFAQQAAANDKKGVPTVGYNIREDWSDTGSVIAAGTKIDLRFLTVDVQADHFYWVERHWSRDGRSRLYDCGIAQTWDELAQYVKRRRICPRFVGVDCGYRTDEVFKWCATNGATALRGDRRNGWDWRTPSGRVEKAYSPKEVIQVAPRLYCGRHFWSDMRCKDILTALRKKGVERWSYAADAPKNYEKMLYSEEKNARGVWEQIGRRPNHYWDCEAMQVCFALMAGII